MSACQPGQKCDVSVVIRTPEIPGRFVSYYRLKEPLVMGGKLFGEKVWVDFFVEIVEEEDEESEKAIVDQALVEVSVFIGSPFVKCSRTGSKYTEM